MKIKFHKWWSRTQSDSTASNPCSHCTYGESRTPSELESHAKEGCLLCILGHEVVSQLIPESHSAHCCGYRSSSISQRYCEVKCLLDGPNHLFEIFTTPCPTSVPPWLPINSLPTGNTGSDQCLRKLCAWVDECNSLHTACRVGHSPLPTRVLRIQQKMDKLEVKLHQSKQEECAPYTCLSHCWGSARHKCQTTKQTMELHYDNISWESMPRTFQDAVYITFRLGLQGLWIDSLCICQDDELDWQSESSKMSEVYQRAFLVIAAASASDATGGCFSTIAQEYDAKVLRKTCPEVSSLPIYARKLLPHPVPRRTFATEVRGVRWERSKFPLLERAWTY
ncbi:heterokaryon incompatibility protein-domain-containing protein [Diaporthe sp. PMI_573]|nr:heterokaryon incompatibility protein-domain-containing protein [Diaporthaceae sp. PMI_573]